jgi:hypothetical protein
MVNFRRESEFLEPSADAELYPPASIFQNQMFFLFLCSLQAKYRYNLNRKHKKTGVRGFDPPLSAPPPAGTCEHAGRAMAVRLHPVKPASPAHSGRCSSFRKKDVIQ